MTSRAGLRPLTSGGSECREAYYSRGAMRSMVV